MTKWAVKVGQRLYIDIDIEVKIIIIIIIILNNNIWFIIRGVKQADLIRLNPQNKQAKWVSSFIF